MDASKRIVTNTLATYVKLVVLAAVGLFATPTAVHALGATNYGIFSVIGGCLAFLTSLNGALTASAQRHIAHALGADRRQEVVEWFSASLVVHCLLGLAMAAGSLATANWILQRVLNLPLSRFGAATWIYRMVVVTTAITILSMPYQALLMAHESFVSVSFINAGAATLLLVGVAALKYLPGDLLLWYGATVCLFQVSGSAGTAIYCIFRYPECHQISRNGVVLRTGHLLRFSAFSLFPSLSSLIRAQGTAVLLNVFFGTAANAAYGLAVQVYGFAGQIVWAFLGAVAPQIVKRYAAGDGRGMATLSSQSNTYAFGILWMIVAPLLLEMHFCLRLWLRTPPAMTAFFLTPVMISLMVDQLTSGYWSSIAATGEIGKYSVVVGVANCIGVPIGYFMLLAGMPANAPLWAIVAGSGIAGIARLWCVRSQANIYITEWLRTVLVPAMVCVLVSLALIIPALSVLPESLVRFVVIVSANGGVCCLTMWYFGTTTAQRDTAKTLAWSLLSYSQGRVRCLPRAVKALCHMTKMENW